MCNIGAGLGSTFRKGRNIEYGFAIPFVQYEDLSTTRDSSAGGTQADPGKPNAWVVSSESLFQLCFYETREMVSERANMGCLIWKW